MTLAADSVARYAGGKQILNGQRPARNGRFCFGALAAAIDGRRP